ncbi:MAG TPA: hypothetical protein VKE70_38840 [Candidatus Solibacter sp.]|nr:hypothetical protein [Candidatus Solibacter sp.]
MAHDAIVPSKTIRGIEPTHARPAQRAPALFIQRKSVLEGRPAAYAEEFGVERLRRFNALAAHGIAEKLVQRIAANAAAIGEEEGKKGVRG